eukprot:TRINITY_DN8327_c0_g5_i1.p1 TRINITY_DN8327_c0_g5~~TRINITY_DN8327_c0_g5_i1.p1  ORF type:complete len:2069 (-),score=443.97 TRINITY_DN8327_c0_g5_i1:251-6457(-)
MAATDIVSPRKMVSDELTPRSAAQTLVGYQENHQIELFMQEMLSVVLAILPEDPFEYMTYHIASHRPAPPPQSDEALCGSGALWVLLPGGDPLCVEHWRLRRCWLTEAGTFCVSNSSANVMQTDGGKLTIRPPPISAPLSLPIEVGASYHEYSEEQAARPFAFSFSSGRHAPRLELAAGSDEQRDEWFNLFGHFADADRRQGAAPKSGELSPRVPLPETDSKPLAGTAVADPIEVASIAPESSIKTVPLSKPKASEARTSSLRPILKSKASTSGPVPAIRIPRRPLSDDPMEVGTESSRRSSIRFSAEVEKQEFVVSRAEPIPANLRAHESRKKPVVTTNANVSRAPSAQLRASEPQTSQSLSPSPMQGTAISDAIDVTSLPPPPPSHSGGRDADQRDVYKSLPDSQTAKSLPAEAAPPVPAARSFEDSSEVIAKALPSEGAPAPPVPAARASEESSEVIAKELPPEEGEAAEDVPQQASHPTMSREQAIEAAAKVLAENVKKRRSTASSSSSSSSKRETRMKELLSQLMSKMQEPSGTSGLVTEATTAVATNVPGTSAVTSAEATPFPDSPPHPSTPLTGSKAVPSSSSNSLPAGTAAASSDDPFPMGGHDFDNAGNHLPTLVEHSRPQSVVNEDPSALHQQEEAVAGLVHDLAAQAAKHTQENVREVPTLTGLPRPTDDDIEHIAAKIVSSRSAAGKAGDVSQADAKQVVEAVAGMTSGEAHRLPSPEEVAMLTERLMTGDAGEQTASLLDDSLNISTEKADELVEGIVGDLFDRRLPAEHEGLADAEKRTSHSEGTSKLSPDVMQEVVHLAMGELLETSQAEVPSELRLADDALPTQELVSEAVDHLAPNERDMETALLTHRSESMQSVAASVTSTEGRGDIAAAMLDAMMLDPIISLMQEPLDPMLALMGDQISDDEEVPDAYTGGTDIPDAIAVTELPPLLPPPLPKQERQEQELDETGKATAPAEVFTAAKAVEELVSIDEAANDVAAAAKAEEAHPPLLPPSLPSKQDKQEQELDDSGKATAPAEGFTTARAAEELTSDDQAAKAVVAAAVVKADDQAAVSEALAAHAASQTVASATKAEDEEVTADVAKLEEIVASKDQAAKEAGLANAEDEVALAQALAAHAASQKVASEANQESSTAGGGNPRTAAILEEPVKQSDLGEVQQEAFQLYFATLKLDEVDQTALKEELLNGFQTLGVKQEQLLRLEISFREGSIIADVRGPLSIIQELQAKPLDSLQLLGCKAEYMSSPAAEAKQSSEEAASARRSRIEASSQVSGDSDPSGKGMKSFVATDVGTYADISTNIVQPQSGDATLQVSDATLQGSMQSEDDARSNASGYSLPAAGRTSGSAPVVPPLWEPHARSDGLYGWRAPSDVSDSAPPSRLSTQRAEEPAVPTFVPQQVLSTSFSSSRMADEAPATMDMQHQQGAFAAEAPVPSLSSRSFASSRRLDQRQQRIFSARSDRSGFGPAQGEESGDAHLPVFVPLSARSADSGWSSYVPADSNPSMALDAGVSGYSWPAGSLSSRSRSSSGYYRADAEPAGDLVDPNIISQLCSLLNPPSTPPGEDDRLRERPVLLGGRSERLNYEDSPRRPSGSLAGSVPSLPEKPVAVSRASEGDAKPVALPAEVPKEQAIDRSPVALPVALPAAVSMEQAIERSPAASHASPASSSRGPRASSARSAEMHMIASPTQGVGYPAGSPQSSARSLQSSARSQAGVGSTPRYVPRMPSASISSSSARSAPLGYPSHIAAERSPSGSSAGGDDAFSRLTQALCRGADALLDSSRSGSSDGFHPRQRARNASGPRVVPVADQALAALTLQPMTTDLPAEVKSTGRSAMASQRSAKSTEKSAPSRASFGSSGPSTGRVVWTKAPSPAVSDESLGEALGSVQRPLKDLYESATPPTEQELLSQQLLGSIQQASRRPTEAEISAMAGRIATAKRMTNEQELQVRGMLKDIANALFGEESSHTQAAQAAQAEQPAQAAQAAQASQAAAPAPSSAAAASSGSGHTGSSGMNTARSSIITARSSVRSNASSSDQDGDVAEALDQEVTGLLDDLFDRHLY